MIPILRTCDVENMADFSRYYSGSWIGYHPSDAANIQPCYVARMLDADTAQLRPLVRNPNNQFIIEAGFPANWSFIKERIDFGTPDIGMMPDGPTILFCSYTTPRVAKKGYRSRDTRTNEFNTWDIRRKYVSPAAGDRYDWTWFAFNPEYLTLEQAEIRLANGESVGVPISRTLGVYTSPKFKNSLLAYKRWTVGHVITPNLIQIKREYEDYEEDIARQTGAEVIVG